MRLRGYRPKPTNLTPVRVQALLTLLEAVEPPTYAVTRMYLPGGGEDLTELLEYVVVQIYGNWARLAVETRDAVLRTLNSVRAGMVPEGNGYTVNVRNVVETLHLFEAMPETLHYACHAFLAGKLDAAAETPPQLYTQAPISARLAELLTHPMPLAGGTPGGDSGQALPDRDKQPPREEPAPIVPTPMLPPEPEPVAEPAPIPQPAPEILPEPAPEPGLESLPELLPELLPEAEPVLPVPPEPAALPEEPLPPAPPRFLRDPVQPTMARTEREFYTDVRFPQQVHVGDEIPLIVRLTRAPWTTARAGGEAAPDYDQLDRPDYVEVVVVATGFNEATATWSRTIAVYSDHDSQPAIFLLRAGRELGDKRVTVDFYHKARYLGSAAFVTKVVDKASETLAGVTVDREGLVTRFVDQPPPPADLELRIVRGSSDNILSFMLHSTKAGVGYHWRPMGQVRLSAANPQAYLETVFAHLSQVTAKTVDPGPEDDAQVNQAQIDAIGRQLFRELLPTELQHEFWTRIRPRRRDSANPNGAIETLLITSDEPWIPWEMVKPYFVDPDSGDEQSDGFLSETFQVSRWLAGRGPVDTVHVQAAGIVAPDNALAYTQTEEAFFRTLPSKRVQAGDALRSVAGVLHLAQTGGVQLLHVAAHGRHEGANADLSSLSLEDGVLTPDDFSGERAAGLWKERPLVFLNLCHTARPAFSLTRLGDWVERMVGDVGVSALVGTLWEVNDLSAAEFAVTFYTRLLAGDTVGRAFHLARLHVRDHGPTNPAWLAYVLYADPNSTVYWGSEEAPSDEESESTLLPAPQPEPEPALDLEDLRAVLEATLAGSLAELVKRTVPEAVATALELWTAETSPQDELPPAEELLAGEVAAEEPAPEAQGVEPPAPETPSIEESTSEVSTAEQLVVEEPVGDDAPEQDAPATQPAPAESSAPLPSTPPASDLTDWMPAEWLSAREASLRNDSAPQWSDAPETGTPENGAVEEDAPGKDG